MAIFRDRLPARQDVVLVFAVCAFPVYSWSILSFFDRLPRWLLHLDPWAVIGIFAYAQMFALLESLSLLLVLLFLSAVLPVRLFRNRF